MSGTISVFFGAWVLFFEPRNETVKSAFIWTSIICAVLTFYQLWSNEHKKYLAEKAKNAANPLNYKIKAVEAEWVKLTNPERKLLSQFSLEGGEMTANKIKFFCEEYGISNWANPSEPTNLYKSSGLLQETPHGWKIPEGLREAVEHVVSRHIDEQGGLGAFSVHGFIGDAREAEAERQRAEKAQRFELARELEVLLKEGQQKLRMKDFSGAAFWEVEVKMRIEKGLGKWQAEEFSKETDIKLYPYPAMSRHQADMFYTLTERLGAIITELKKD